MKKRFVATLFGFVLALSVTACGEAGTSTVDTPVTPVEEPVVEPPCFAGR